MGLNQGLGSRSFGFARVLGTSVFLGIILVFLAVATQVLRPSRKGIPAAAQKQAKQALEMGVLSCSDVMALAQWSLKRYGGPQKVEFTSSKFAEKAATVFLEKLDSNRLLFTEQEVERFRNSAVKAWPGMIANQNCDFFDQWVAAHYPVAERRFWTQVSIYQAPKLRKTKKSDELPRFKNWAADASALNERIRGYSTAAIVASSPKVIAAYQGDVQKFLKVVFEESLFSASNAPEKLLAKSVLGSIDHFSTYFSKDEFEDFYSDLSGGASGIGIRVSKVPAGLMIEKILSNSAASQTKKLHEGDVISAVDGIRVENLSFAQAKHLLKGVEDSFVRLTITPEGKTESTVVSLQRKQFAFEESKITGRIVKNGKQNVAVVTVPNFYGRGGMGNLAEERSSAEDLKEVLTGLLANKEANVPLVLDLRGNPGGYLEEAVAMAGMFVGSEPVVGVVENQKTRVMKEEMPELIPFDGAMVVLVDEETASAGEVLAGALKDHQRAVLVGSSRTYGKGSVQKLFHLDDPMLQVGLGNTVGNGVLKLTTSVFYSPLGHSPANGGVSTHIVLEETGSDLAPVNPVPELEPLLDAQALAMLQGKEEVMKQRIAILSKHRESRDQSGSTATEDSELNEAVEIAVDAQALQQAAHTAR